MAKCSICEKGAHFGNNVSHSHRRSNRMWKSNIKSVKAVVNGTPKKIYQQYTFPTATPIIHLDSIVLLLLYTLIYS